MDSRNIYSDIANRTGGDIYIGVVGPVRTGKSTFIKKSQISKVSFSGKEQSMSFRSPQQERPS